MKPELLTLSFLLVFAFPLAFSDDDFGQGTVLDRNGNPVFSGTPYLIFSSLPGETNLSTLSLVITGNSTRPATVAVGPGNQSIPVNFTQGDSLLISTNTATTIEFLGNSTDGVAPTRWVAVLDDDIGQIYVGIGGTGDHPNQQIYTGNFQIINFSSSRYALEFCGVPNPSVCRNIGLYGIGDEQRLLVLTAGLAEFNFELAEYQPTPGIRTVV